MEEKMSRRLCDNDQQNHIHNLNLLNISPRERERMKGFYMYSTIQNFRGRKFAQKYILQI